MIDYSNCSLVDERAGTCGLSPQQFFEHYLLPARPVVLRGYARRYELFTRWTPSYFLRTHGDINVRVSEIPYAQQWGVQGDTLPLKEHIQAMLACTPEAAVTGLSRAGGGGDNDDDDDGDACAMPRPLVDIPPELCAAFTQDDGSFVRRVDGDEPLPSSRCVRARCRLGRTRAGRALNHTRTHTYTHTHTRACVRRTVPPRCEPTRLTACVCVCTE